MKMLDAVVASVFLVLGLRSVVYWGSRTFAGADVRDHLLYALYVTGRAGLWFAFAGLFGLMALVDGEGRTVVDLRENRWYVLVFLGLGVLQLLAGWFLGRRRSERAHEPARDSGE
jgi:hypothetical protein